MIIKNEDDIRYCRRLWRLFHVLVLSQELGLLRQLEQSPSTSKELANTLKLDDRAIEVCLDLLSAYGFVVFANNQYRLPQSSLNLLPSIDELAHEVPLISKLKEVLTSGYPAIPTSGGIVSDEKVNFFFLQGLARRSESSLSEAIKLVVEACNNHVNKKQHLQILDLGGGHGRFAAAFAAALPEAKVFLFDREAITPLAHKISGDGFITIPGDLTKDSLGGPYNVIFMSNLLHAESISWCQVVIQRVRQALTDGGTIIIRDRFLNEYSPGPDYAADFGITLLLNTLQGQPRKLYEMRTLLNNFGFNNIQYQEIATEEYGYLTAKIS